MILYHGTTFERAKEIFDNRKIKSNVPRFYTKEKSGNGYSTQGYIYLTNEITFSVYFANAHRKSDKPLYIFKVEIPYKELEADYDEIRCQNINYSTLQSYENDLLCSLEEVKSCRISKDISFDDYHISVCSISSKADMKAIIGNAGYSYTHTINNYNDAQKHFIDSIDWKSVDTVFESV